MLLLVTFYFLFYDPKIRVMQTSISYENILLCEQVRLEIKSKLKHLNEFQQYWISPLCEEKVNKERNVE